MKQVEFYKTESGKEPVHEWLLTLDKVSHRKVLAYVKRLQIGATKKNVRSVGDGVFEIKIDYGPGLRVYFSEIGNVIVLLLLGGDKGSQFRDIQKAKEYRRDYVSK